MTYKQFPDAISISSSKQAALYFDKVFPLDICEVWDMGDEGEKILFDLLGTEAKDALELYSLLFDHAFLEDSEDVIGECYVELSKDTWPEVYYSNTPGKELSNYLSMESWGSHAGLLTYRGATHLFAKEFGFSDNPSIVISHESAKRSDVDTDTDVCMALTGLNLIETDDVSWEQIIELRQDKEAKKQLRRLRLFMYKNYEGKPKSFIEDDLHRTQDDYVSAAKKHGFNLVTESLQAILTSNLVKTGGVLSFLAAISGRPLAALVASGTALSLEIGSIAVEVAKNRYSLKSLRDQHDLGFIFTAKERLGQ